MAFPAFVARPTTAWFCAFDQVGVTALVKRSVAAFAIPVDVVAADNVNWVPLVIVMVVPAGIFVPEMPIPLNKVAVDATVTVEAPPAVAAVAAKVKELVTFQLVGSVVPVVMASKFSVTGVVLEIET